MFLPVGIVGVDAAVEGQGFGAMGTRDQQGRHAVRVHPHQHALPERRGAVQVRALRERTLSRTLR